MDAAFCECCCVVLRGRWCGTSGWPAGRRLSSALRVVVCRAGGWAGDSSSSDAAWAFPVRLRSAPGTGERSARVVRRPPLLSLLLLLLVHHLVQGCTSASLHAVPQSLAAARPSFISAGWLVSVAVSSSPSFPSLPLSLFCFCPFHLPHLPVSLVLRAYCIGFASRIQTDAIHTHHMRSGHSGSRPRASGEKTRVVCINSVREDRRIIRCTSKCLASVFRSACSVPSYKCLLLTFTARALHALQPHPLRLVLSPRQPLHPQPHALHLLRTHRELDVGEQ